VVIEGCTNGENIYLNSGDSDEALKGPGGAAWAIHGYLEREVF
jgi:hypothetical protein